MSRRHGEVESKGWGGGGAGALGGVFHGAVD